MKDARLCTELIKIIILRQLENGVALLHLQVSTPGLSSAARKGVFYRMLYSNLNLHYNVLCALLHPRRCVISWLFFLSRHSFCMLCLTFYVLCLTFCVLCSTLNKVLFYWLCFILEIVFSFSSDKRFVCFALHLCALSFVLCVLSYIYVLCLMFCVLCSTLDIVLFHWLCFIVEIVFPFSSDKPFVCFVPLQNATLPWQQS